VNSLLMTHKMHLCKTKPSHLMRSKFIDLNCLRLKWGKTIFVIPFTFWNTFWAWIIFLSWKKIPTRITPHTKGQEKISMRKEKKLWESQKGIRAQETQMLGGMPKSLENVTSKIKWVCPSKAIKKKKQQIKEKRQKKIGMTSRVKLLIVILSL